MTVRAGAKSVCAASVLWKAIKHSNLACGVGKTRIVTTVTARAVGLYAGASARRTVQLVNPATAARIATLLAFATSARNPTTRLDTGTPAALTRTATRMVIATDTTIGLIVAKATAGPNSTATTHATDPVSVPPTTVSAWRGTGTWFVRGVSAVER